MVEYKCFRCGYIATQRCNFKNHLNRKNICKPTLDDISIKELNKYYELETSTKPPQNSTFFHNSPQNNLHIFPQNLHKNPQFSTKSPQKSTILNNKYICLYCNKKLSRSDSLHRHVSICKKKNDKTYLALENKERELEEKDQKIKELEEKIKYKSNTNIINNTINNTININNYGDENLKHLKTKDFAKLLSGIYNAVPRLIEKIHFDPNHPENHNIKITNKKLPYLKVLKNDKWQLVNKKNELLDLIDNKYFMLKKKYYTLLEKNKYNISNEQKIKIDKFIDKYEEEDKQMLLNLIDKTELILINN